MRFGSVLLALLLGGAATGFVQQTAFRRPSYLSVAVDTSEIKNGMTIELDGEPYKVLGFSIMKQARGAAKTTIKFKNLMRGTTLENTYRSGEKFETALIEKLDAQFTYQEGVRPLSAASTVYVCRRGTIIQWMVNGDLTRLLFVLPQQDSFFFMNSETFEEIAVGNKVVGDKAQWIGEGSLVKLVTFKGGVIEVVPPSPAVYVIVETEPTMKGNTASAHTKPAVLDCGATISVPGFLEQGTKIRVDTEKGEYLERVTG